VYLLALLCLCVLAFVRACVRAFVRACVRVCVRACVCVRALRPARRSRFLSSFVYVCRSLFTGYSSFLRVSFHSSQVASLSLQHTLQHTLQLTLQNTLKGTLQHTLQVNAPKQLFPLHPMLVCRCNTHCNTRCNSHCYTHCNTHCNTHCK